MAEPTDGPEQDDNTPAHLWPENWPVWCLWRDVETQFNAGVNGATGLDYAGVWAVIGQRFRRRERKTVFYLLQAMEEATLAEWREREAGKAG